MRSLEMKGMLMKAVNLGIPWADEDNSVRHSLSFGERSDPQMYHNFSHGIPKFTGNCQSVRVIYNFF
jgi:hypothetical protein